MEPSRGWASLKLSELWEYRELLFFLTWRDIIIRYKQTVLGAAWAILQPFLTMIVFTVFFGKVVKVPSDGLPYPLFYFIALVPWMLFSNGLTLSSNSLVSSANLIKKVYFPRLAIPVATILAGLVDFVLAFIVGLGLMLYYGYPLMVSAFWLLPLLLLALITSLGVGLWFSALNVQYRDIRYVVPFLTQVWLFATPIAYPSSLIEQPWRTIYAINPMVGVVEGFRWALLGSTVPSGLMLVVSAAAALFVLVSGLFYFRRMEKTFADVV
jgi:lipopolysaccharide transport system permease protein